MFGGFRQVHGPDARPELEVEPSHEPEGRQKNLGRKNPLLSAPNFSVSKLGFMAGEQVRKEQGATHGGRWKIVERRGSGETVLQ
jgi:hypothetical protein